MCWMRPCGSTMPGGKESAEHACKAWISDYKLEPLPLRLIFPPFVLYILTLSTILNREN